MAANFEFGQVEDAWTHKNGKPTYWFVGSFIEDDTLRKTDSFECKWAVHQPEDGIVERYDESAELTISILVKGRVTYWLRRTGESEWTDRTLEKVGEFVIWNPNVDHKLFALQEDTVLFTVRRRVPDGTANPKSKR